MFHKSFIIIIIFFLIFGKSLAKENVFIVLNIDDRIITNYDIIKESDYLKILNPNLAQLDKKQIQEIAKSSLIKEIIKKKEIEKVLDLSKENNFLNQYIVDLYTKLNFENENDFKSFLSSSSNYSLDEIKKKINIELMWNELIYLRYGDQIILDKKKFLKKIENLKGKIRKEYKLSEIVFKKDKDTNLDIQINKILSSIMDIGFENTANIYSISESSKMGGDIGWINENNLSELISKNIKDLKQNEITKPIQIGNNFLLLKVNEIRSKNVPINKQEELDKMIKFETNKQLNQFSKIFFDKTKINYSINEK